MALTGLDIFKLLPKTNCGECGVPTCMAFAMKLAQKAANISDCPYASANAVEVLGAASRPLIHLVKSGNGDNIWQKIVNGDRHVTKEGVAVGEALLKIEAEAGHMNLYDLFGYAKRNKIFA